MGYGYNGYLKRKIFPPKIEVRLNMCGQPAHGCYPYGLEVGTFGLHDQGHATMPPLPFGKSIWYIKLF